MEGTLGLRLDQDRIGSFRSFARREMGIREAFVVQVMAVEEYFTDGTTKYEAIERIKKRLHEAERAAMLKGLDSNR